MFIFLGLFVHAAVRGGTCAFTLKSVNTLIKNSSRDDRPSISTQKQPTCQPGSCRARPVNVDDGLEDIRWIRGLAGEKLPAASNALLPNLKKALFFAIGEGSRNFVACFLHPNVFVSDAWPAPATYHRSFG